MNRREFGKGAVLSVIAGLLGIGAKVGKKRRVIHAKSGSLSVNGLLVAGEGAKTTLAPCPSPEFEPSKGFYADAVVDVSDWMEKEMARVIAHELDRAFLYGG